MSSNIEVADLLVLTSGNSLSGAPLNGPYVIEHGTTTGRAHLWVPIICAGHGRALSGTVILHLLSGMRTPSSFVQAIGLSDQTWSALLIPAPKGRLPRTYR
ncbi:MAG: hypothetical protein IPN85_02335 [Flavobacteriales bacterium]|nr:hypothetical protein [Flavobacteriales bacterium]MBK9287265.1 hypothetical protein [Flavobacteriales bacterium]